MKKSKLGKEAQELLGLQEMHTRMLLATLFMMIKKKKRQVKNRMSIQMCLSKLPWLRKSLDIHSVDYLVTMAVIGLPQLKAMAPHSSTLAWKIPWREEPSRLQSMGSLRVGHD